jgi:hypothetical protein
MKDMKIMKGPRTKLNAERDPVQTQLMRSRNSILHALHDLHGATLPIRNIDAHPSRERSDRRKRK